MDLCAAVFVPLIEKRVVTSAGVFYLASAPKIDVTKAFY